MSTANTLRCEVCARVVRPAAGERRVRRCPEHVNVVPLFPKSATKPRRASGTDGGAR